MKLVSFLLPAFLLSTLVLTLMPSCNDDDGPLEPVASCDDNMQNGNETGVDCGGDCPDCVIGLMGEWQSSGADVSTLLVDLFAIDSIYANFRTDNTFVFEQFDSSGTKSVMEGTYSQTMSGVGQIWTIKVQQTSPIPLTLEGIFEIAGNTMVYEVLQTIPNVGGTPPTAQLGFGSSISGALGNTNVQTYRRIE